MLVSQRITRISSARVRVWIEHGNLSAPAIALIHPKILGKYCEDCEMSFHYNKLRSPWLGLRTAKRHYWLRPGQRHLSLSLLVPLKRQIIHKNGQIHENKTLTSLNLFTQPEKKPFSRTRPEDCTYHWLQVITLLRKRQFPVIS